MYIDQEDYHRKRSCLALGRRFAEQFCFFYGSVTYIKKIKIKIVTVKSKKHRLCLTRFFL